jgi:prepilin-type processing-associated H-X9-DG protein
LNKQNKAADATSGWNDQYEGPPVSNYHVRYRHNINRRNYKYVDSISTIQYNGATGYCNFLFVDGHAASLAPGELKLKNIATWY